eukprot:697834-Prymnesium_polylepis.1
MSRWRAPLRLDCATERAAAHAARPCLLLPRPLVFVPLVTLVPLAQHHPSASPIATFLPRPNPSARPSPRRVHSGEACCARCRCPSAACVGRARPGWSYRHSIGSRAPRCERLLRAARLIALTLTRMANPHTLTAGPHL